MEKPTILFLQETKCNSEDLESYSRRLWKGASTMVMDVVGATSGIGVLWNPNMVSLSNFVAYRNTLSTRFHVLGTSVRGVLSNIYDPF